MITCRPAKTFADCAAITVCPVLIMLVVGSLLFFLLSIGYAGSHLRELHWTFFWFVLAMVLVSRIAIEKGSEHAWIYGLGLAGATAFMLSQYIAFNLWVWALLGLIWWASNKLTWDCTVIDDDEDSSGEGLLQAAKLDPPASGARPSACAATTNGRIADNRGEALRHSEAAAPEDGRAPAARSGARPPRAPAKLRWWEQALAKRPASARQPHAPGLWVIYFSLAALPVFGLGQGLIPESDTKAREYASGLLVIYLAAALGLLLITSFLGLRRYLRQRQLEMPAAMAATWISTGALIGTGILVACLLLPRPSATWSLTAMIDRLGDPTRKPARQNKTSVNPRVESTGGNPEQGRKASSASDTAQIESSANTSAKAVEPSHSSGENGKAQPPPQPASTDETKHAAKLGSTDQVTRQKPPTKNVGNASEVHETAAAPPPALKPSLRSLLRALRLVIYAALLAAGGFVIVRARGALLKSLRELWRSLREFWRSLFAREGRTAPDGSPGVPDVPRRPFAALANPFASGATAQMSLEELVVYSFNGLEAWAEEHHCGRQPDQTPYEFAERVVGEAPDLAHEAEQLTRLYVEVAYAKATALPACRTMLEILWSKMTSEAG